MPSTFTTNKGIEQPSAGSYNDTWATPVNADWEDIDNAFGGNTQISVTGISSGTVTLALAQYQPPNIVFAGVLSGTLAYIVPAGVGGLWTVFNNTSGAFSLMFGSGGGGSYTIPQGTRVFLVCDGVNMNLVATPTPAGNPTAQVELTPVNGSASTFMRSDAAPPLDQSIEPTWTNTHIFSSAVQLNGHTEIGASGFLQLSAGGSSIDATAGQLTVATQAPGDNSTRAASTQFVDASFAPLASPDLTGIPTAPTAPNGTNTTQIATTAYVETYANGMSGSGWTVLPNGKILMWGVFPGQPSSPGTIIFPKSGGFPTACESIVVTPITNSSSFQTSNPSASTTQFTLNFGASNTPFSWMAFGY